jgi:hypothetical protein
MAGLLLLVPLACIPLLLASLTQWLLFSDSLVHQTPKIWLMASYVSLVCVLAITWGWRSAQRYLSPQRVVRFHSDTQFFVATSDRSVTQLRARPLPALLWQFASQNSALLGGLIGLLAVSMLMLCFGAENIAPRRPIDGTPFAGIGMLGCWLGICWLGQLTFHGDSINRRILFLADRGVSPLQTWCTRQAIPLAIVVVGLMAFFIFIWARGYLGLLTATSGFTSTVLLALCLYSVSQWTGQLVRSPIVGAIVAPFAAAGVAAYLIYASIDLGAPLWMIALTIVLPLLTTLLDVRNWMDQRYVWRSWMLHGLTLLLIFFIPTSYFLIYIASYPRMSPAVKADLHQIAGVTSSSQLSEPYIALPPAMVAGEEGTQSWLTTAERRDIAKREFKQLLATNPAGVPDIYAINTCIADAVVAREGDADVAQDDLIRAYREAVELVAICHEHLRRSHRLAIQDRADGYAIWLLGEMLQPHAQQRLGQALYSRIRSTLADIEQLQRARQKAIAISWLNARDFNLGGYSMQGASSHVTARDVWETSRKAGLVSEQLLRLSQASTSEAAAIRITLCELMGLPLSMASLEANESDPLYYFFVQGSRLPGVRWRGEWETRAAQLPPWQE